MGHWVQKYIQDNSNYVPGWVKLDPLSSPQPKVTQTSKLKLVFLHNLLGHLKPIGHMKAYRRMWMKTDRTDRNKLGHMTKVAALLIYGSIESKYTSKIIQIMYLGWTWPMLCQGNMWSLRPLYGKMWKVWLFGNYCGYRFQK